MFGQLLLCRFKVKLFGKFCDVLSFLKRKLLRLICCAYHTHVVTKNEVKFFEFVFYILALLPLSYTGYFVTLACDD